MIDGRPHRTWQDRSIATKSAQALALRGGEVAAQLGLIVITARFLGPEGRGLYALALLAATLCVVPLGSVWSALALDVAKRQMRTGRVLTTALVIAAVGGAVIAIAGVGVSFAFGDHWWVVALPAAITPVLLFLTYAQGLYQALGHVVAANAMIVARVASPLVFLSVGIALDAGNRVVLVLWAASLVVLAPPVFLHLSAIAGPKSRPPLNIRPYARRLALGMRLLPGNTALLLNVRVALIVLAGLSTTATVGIYSVAVSGAELLRLASRSVYSGTFAAIGGRDEGASAALAAKAVRHSMLLAAASSILVVPASFVAVPIIFGPGYEEVPSLLALLVPAVIAFAVFPALTAFFGVQVVKPEVVTMAAAIMLGASVLGMLAAVPVFGSGGAAVATSAGAIVGVGYLMRCFIQTTGCQLGDLIPGPADLRDYVSLARRLSPRLSTGPAPGGVAAPIGKVPPAQ
jgi:O-antigen/teichoic acid export membrane protein